MAGTSKSACLFWTLAVTAFVLSGIYVSSCAIGTLCDVAFCPYIETFTIVAVLAFLCTAFWYCYKRKMQNMTQELMLDPLPIFANSPSNHVINRARAEAEPLLRFGSEVKEINSADVPNDFECAICNEHEEGMQVLQLSCQHDFHKSCVLKWFNSNTEHTCPICRTPQRTVKEKLMIITIIPQRGRLPVRITQI